jgi:hypothetical protein
MFVAKATYRRIFEEDQLKILINDLWPESEQMGEYQWGRYPKRASPAEGQYKFTDKAGRERGAMVFALDGIITSYDQIWFVYGPFETVHVARDYAEQRISLQPAAIEVIGETLAQEAGWLVSCAYTDG